MFSCHCCYFGREWRFHHSYDSVSTEHYISKTTFITSLSWFDGNFLRNNHRVSKTKETRLQWQKRNENTANNGWHCVRTALGGVYQRDRYAFANILFMPINFRQTYRVREQMSALAQWLSEWVCMTVFWPIEIQDLCFC